MSPSWRERVAIGFSPLGVSALRVGRGWRPRLRDRHAVLLGGRLAGDFAGGGSGHRVGNTLGNTVGDSAGDSVGASVGDSFGNAADWTAGIAALEALFTEPAWRGRDIAVVLSAHYVRHVVLPAGPRLAEAERQALAAALLQECFGDPVRDWAVRVSPVRAPVPTVACAVPPGLLAALRAVCAGRGRLRSIRPVLMPFFNRVWPAIGRTAGCLALVEPGRITLASVADGRWQHIDSRAGEGAALPRLLLESGTVHGRQPGGLLWLGDLTGHAVLPDPALWSHLPVPPPRLPGIAVPPCLAAWGLA